MGLHHRHTHGRVFRGLEAREQLEIHRRDSHGNSIKMNIPDNFAQKDDSQGDGSENAVSVVYVTLSQTFAGPATFQTLTAAPSDAQPTSHTELDVIPPATTSDVPSSVAFSAIKPTDAAHTSDVAALTTLVTATSSLRSTHSGVVLGSPVQTTSSPNLDDSDSTSLSASASASSEPTPAGMSGAATAGLVIGILVAIAFVGALVFFCWRKQKKQQKGEVLDEKHASFADAGARRVEAGGNRNSTSSDQRPASIRSTRTASTAPRLSLRPVTQFLPNLAENRKSAANNLDVAAAGFAEKSKSPWERRASSNNVKQNPFDDAPVLSEKQARPESPPSNPFDESSDVPRSGPGAVAAPVFNANEPAKGPKSQGPPAAPPGAAGPPRGPNNVHRVQLDFKPSMDDELELRSGQLVRMLHEYDDGWALCIRLDRSQQGVVPRTCLSKLPVKPRPQGPPPGSRPGPGPNQVPRGPIPQGNPNGSMYPRPLTPTQSGRSPSPQEARSDSSGAPTDAPVRKPVPGMAM